MSVEPPTWSGWRRSRARASAAAVTGAILGLAEKVPGTTCAAPQACVRGRTVAAARA